MKYIFFLLAITFAESRLTACKENTSGADGNETIRSEPPNSKPPEPNISSQATQDRIDSVVRGALSMPDDSITMEAANVIAETHNAIHYLMDSNSTAAIKAIEAAIGKAEVITTVKPDMKLVPLERKVAVQDLITDMETLKRVREDIESLTDKGYLQDVRKMIDMLISEITTITSFIPLESYPVALKRSVELAREKKFANAALLLNTALNTIVIYERSVPLPLIRAEIMLAAADSLLKANDSKEDDINILLDNADYQIRFAEELGYGTRDKEYDELYDAIKQMKREVKNKGSERKNMISRLRQKLDSFKKRISPDVAK